MALSALHNTQQHYNLQPFTHKQLMKTLQKLKKNKAPGPNSIPMEAFQNMNKTNLAPLLELLNKWLEGKDEALQANIAMIYKKGNTENLDNYRPIALLNAQYKIFAALLQKRIAAGLDQHLQKTQFGFRKHKSTKQPLMAAKRLISQAEATGINILVLFLDFEKTFDKIDHSKLVESLKRLDIPEKLTKVIANLYKAPTFKVETAGRTVGLPHATHRHQTGLPALPLTFLSNHDGALSRRHFPAQH